MGARSLLPNRSDARIDQGCFRGAHHGQVVLGRERVAQVLRRDHRVLRAGSAEAGLALIGKDGVDVVLADRALPGVSGFDFLRIVRENYPLAEFVMLADEPDVDAAVAAVKLGAYHFLVKAASPEAVLSIVAQAGNPSFGTSSSIDPDIFRSLMLVSLLASFVTAALVYPFVSSAIVIRYLDQRMRQEDLAVRLAPFRARGDKGQGRGVEHHLQRHQHENDIAPQHQSQQAATEQDARQRQHMFHGYLQAAHQRLRSRRTMKRRPRWYAPTRPASSNMEAISTAST